MVWLVKDSDLKASPNNGSWEIMFSFLFFPYIMYQVLFSDLMNIKGECACRGGFQKSEQSG